MRHITIRVVDTCGRPQVSTKVALWAEGASSGFLPAGYTNARGSVVLRLGDGYTSISVLVNGVERISHGLIRAEYKIVI